jgi:hypothetical protein
LRKFLLISLILLFCPAVSAALETGDAYLGAFGGYQKGVISELGSSAYLGLTTSLYQPTLNWGDYRFDFIGFYREDDQDGFELGYLSAEVKNLWLAGGSANDTFLGDGLVHLVTPTLLFEHVGLPTESLRGGGTEVRSEWLTAGVQGGRYTEGDFLVPGAYKTVDGDLAGGYVDLHSPDLGILGMAVNRVQEDEGDHTLVNLYGSHAFGFGELRVAGWYDSLGDDVAGVAGIRRSSEEKYMEAGLLHVPKDFTYLRANTPIFTGETLAFGTYRVNGVREGYYVEGSGGEVDQTDGTAALYRGSLGSYYRLSLRDTVSGSVGCSDLESDSGNDQLRLQQLVRYDLRRTAWDTGLQLQAIQFLADGKDGESGSASDSRYWIGEVSSTYRSTNWDVGGRISLQRKDAEGPDDSTSALVTLEGRGITGMGLTGGAFVQGGMTWGQDSHTEVYGGGTDITLPLPGGWQVRARLRAQRTSYSFDMEPSFEGNSQTAQTSIDFFMIFERRDYWGEPAPVNGNFTGTKPMGVGEIKGRVFVDLDRNGLFDSTDKPLAGVVVRLDDGFVVETDSSGLYRFPNVAAGEHRLTVDPTSFPITYMNPSPDGISVQIYPRDERVTDWPLRPI